MKKSIPRKKLIDLHIELESYKDSFIYIFLTSKIGEFYNENGLRINEIYKQMNFIRRKYLVFENDEQKMDDGKAIFLDGMNEEMFTTEMTEYLSGEVAVKL